MYPFADFAISSLSVNAGNIACVRKPEVDPRNAAIILQRGSRRFLIDRDPMYASAWKEGGGMPRCFRQKSIQTHRR